MARVLIAAAACLLASCAADASTTVVVDVADSLVSGSLDSIVYLSRRQGYPPSEVSHTADDDGRRIAFVSLSGEAGPRIDVVVRGFETESRALSEQEAFWGTGPADREIARVGMRTGFVAGETRFVRMTPRYGCLQPLEPIPEIKSTQLGHEERPLVLDGCDEESEDIDAGPDAALDEDAGAS